MSEIVRLARRVLENAETLADYFESIHIPAPSFDVTGPPYVLISPVESKAAAAQVALLGDTHDLHQLVAGPLATLMGISADDSLSLQAVYRYRLAKTFAVDRETTFESMSQASGLNVVDLQRLLRHAMTNHIFQEPRAGVVAHTATSRLLAENESIEDCIGIFAEEKFKASASVVDALMKWDRAQGPEQTGFSLGHGTSYGVYAELQDHPDRARRWANAMSAIASHVSIEPVARGFDWASLGEAVVVDVGGGHGPASVALAREFSQLSFIVQDFEGVVSSHPEIPEDLASRIRFMAHDFLTEQPHHNAEVYFFRAVLHNWPDPYCVKILQNLVPALRKGAKIIIDEGLLPKARSIPSYLERRQRTADLTMLTFFGSREFDIEDWENLCIQAHSAFRVISAQVSPDRQRILVVIEWQPDS